MKDTSFILLGAGKGERLGFPKIKLKIFNLPIYSYHIKKLEKINFIGEVILTVPEFLFENIKKEIKNTEFNLPLKIVKGGKTRAESVEIAVKKANFEYLLIHDLARPFPSIELIKKIRKKLKTKDLVVPYVNPSDTAIYEDKLIKRESLKLIHTPQGTKKSLILKAFKKTKKRDFPDESTLLKETLSISPFYLKDNFFNFKITFKEDVKILKEIENLFCFKTGLGFDIHRLEYKKGNLILGGIKIKEGIRAIGHSDGDVVIHSLIDAILGAMGKGDIGEYFPDTDKRWKGTKSEFFLKEILKIFKAEGYEFLNIDITVFLEEPKLKDKKRKIKKNLAKILGVKESKINIKAKTFEGLFEKTVACYSLVFVRKI